MLSAFAASLQVPAVLLSAAVKKYILDLAPLHSYSAGKPLFESVAQLQNRGTNACLVCLFGLVYRRECNPSKQVSIWMLLGIRFER